MEYWSVGRMVKIKDGEDIMLFLEIHYSTIPIYQLK